MTAAKPARAQFTIERTYYTLDGKKVDLASSSGGNSELKQNDRLVVVLKVDATNTAQQIFRIHALQLRRNLLAATAT